MRHRRRTYTFLFAAYLQGMFMDVTEAASLSEAKRLFRHLGVHYDLVEAV